MKKNIKVISQTPLLTAELFTVYQTDLDISGQKKIHKDVIRYDAISVFPITENFEIYLIKQYRYLLGKTIVEGIAGMMEKGESPEQTVSRELEEETGIKAKKIEHLLTMNSAASIITWKQHLFIAKELSFDGVKHWDDDEDIELLKITIDEAVQKIYAGEIITSPSIVGILMLDKLRREGKL